MANVVQLLFSQSLSLSPTHTEKEEEAEATDKEIETGEEAEGKIFVCFSGYENVSGQSATFSLNLLFFLSRSHDEEKEDG